MEWLFILALGVWVYRQGRTIKGLERRLNDAEELSRLDRAAATSPTAAPKPPPEPIVSAPWVPPEAPPEPVKPPEPLASPPPPILPEQIHALRAPEPERLVAPEPQPESKAKAKRESEPALWPAPETPPRPRPKPRPMPPPRPAPTITRESISTWLSENGLAWIGGGGLALGGLLLVGYAAQRGLFIPEFRIAMAVILGALMLGASEWILRQKPTITGGRHLLAAAVAAGAGAVTLYGAVCAAHGLYQLIPLGVAAVLAAAISLGLLGLSLRHGEPLALVAVVGAVLAPGFTHLNEWSLTALSAYAVLIGATGFSIAAVRQWGKAGGATAVGLLLLSAAPLGERHVTAAAIIQAVAAFGPFAATLWRRRFRVDDAADPAGRDFRVLPGTALTLTCLASFGLWFISSSHAWHLPVAAVMAGLLVALAAIMVEREIIKPDHFALPVGVAIVCQLLAMALMGRWSSFPAQLPWLYALTGVIPAAALWAALRLPAVGRTRMLTIGGVGVAILATLTWPLLRAAHIELAWLPAAVLAAAMFALSALIARRVEQAANDRGLTLWLAAAAELAFLAIHAAVAPRFEPAAFALAAVALALAASRLSWRGLAATSVAGGLVAFAAMLRPEFVVATLETSLPLPTMLAVSGAAAALLVVAAQLIWRGGGEALRNEVEAQRATALLITLLALFVGLHVMLAGDQPRGLDGLFEASLRTLLLLSAGLLLVLRQREDDGPITRARTIIVVTVGVAHGLFMQGLAWNPWWGLGQPPVGPPVLNTLVLSYLAPLGLLVAIAWRRKPAENGWTRAWLLAAPVFGFLWALLTLRHAVHGADMRHAGLDRQELAAIAVLLMLTARALVEPRVGMASPQARLLRATAPAVGWVALAFMALAFGLVANPWWGIFPEPLSPLWKPAALFGLQIVAIALAWGVSRKEATVGRAALALAVLLTLALAATLIRWAFHGPVLPIGEVGRAESAAYVILALLAARPLTSPRLAERPSAGWVARLAPGYAVLALLMAILVFAVRASPWWGPFSQPLAPAGSAALLFGLYAAGAGAMLLLRRGDGRFDRAAVAGAVGTLFVLLTLVIRYAFHGAEMSMATRGNALETWTFSALWAVFGLAVLGLGSARKNIVLRWAGLAALLFTAAKVLVFDLARLEGVTRAASFLAVGALFLGGALLARRLNARHKPVEAEGEP